MLKCLKLFQNIGSISKSIFPRRERGFTFDFSIRILSFGKDQKNVVPRLYRSQDGVLKTSIVSLRVRSAAMKMASDKSSRVPFFSFFQRAFSLKEQPDTFGARYFMRCRRHNNARTDRKRLEARAQPPTNSSSKVSTLNKIYCHISLKMWNKFFQTLFPFRLFFSPKDFRNALDSFGNF